MKTSNVKSIGLSLSAIFLIAFMVQSCTQVELPVPSEKTISTQLSIEDQNPSHHILEEYQTIGNEYFLPLAIDQGTEEEIQEYLKNISPELEAELVEHTRIVDYLEQINKINHVVSNTSSSEILTTTSVENFLTREEAQELVRFESNSIDVRGCTAWVSAGCGDIPLVVPFACKVRYVCQQTRECDWWNVWSARYRTTYTGPEHNCH